MRSFCPRLREGISNSVSPPVSVSISIDCRAVLSLMLPIVDNPNRLCL